MCLIVFVGIERTTAVHLVEYVSNGTNDSSETTMGIEQEKDAEFLMVLYEQGLKRMSSWQCLTPTHGQALSFSIEAKISWKLELISRLRHKGMPSKAPLLAELHPSNSTSSLVARPMLVYTTKIGTKTCQSSASRPQKTLQIAVAWQGCWTQMFWTWNTISCRYGIGALQVEPTMRLFLVAGTSTSLHLAQAFTTASSQSRTRQLNHSYTNHSFVLLQSAEQAQFQALRCIGKAQQGPSEHLYGLQFLSATDNGSQWHGCPRNRGDLLPGRNKWSVWVSSIGSVYSI